MAGKKRSGLPTPGIPEGVRKQIRPGEKVLMELSGRERELILQHTFAEDELTGRLRIVPRSGERPAYRFTLDDLEELAGYVAAEAHHAKDKKLEKELRRLAIRIAAVLESLTDEDDDRDPDGKRNQPAMARPKKDHIREERIRNEAVVDAYGPEEQAMGWYYYLEGKIQFPFQARCIVSKVVSPLRKGESVEVRRIAPEDACASDMLVLIRWQGRNMAVPLSQLAAIDPDELTEEAIGDWHYWVAQGYRF